MNSGWWFDRTGIYLKGISRLNPHCPKRALPITAFILMEFKELLDLRKPIHATFWCLFLIAVFLMSRKSHLVHSTLAESKTNKQLRRKDFIISENGFTVIIRWSKTIQFRERILEIPVLAIPDSPLCPLSALKQMIHLTPAPEDALAFILPGGKYRPVLYHEFNKMLRVLIRKTGRDPNGYSSHSFRRGAPPLPLRHTSLVN